MIVFILYLFILKKVVGSTPLSKHVNGEPR